MASSLQQIGFENQKILLIQILTYVWKDTQWSYEGVNAFEGDFFIENTKYEVKTFVSGTDKTIKKGSAPKEEIKKAVYQLFEKKSTAKKIIITNKPIYTLDNDKLSDKTYNFLELFKNEPITYTKKRSISKTFTIDQLRTIDVKVVSVENGKTAEELKDKVFNSIKNGIEDKIGEQLVRGVWDGALNAFLQSITDNIAANRSINPIRFLIFHSLSNLQFEQTWFNTDESLRKVNEGIKFIKNQEFYLDENPKAKLGEIGFSNENIDKIYEEMNKIKKWGGILEVSNGN